MKKTKKRWHRRRCKHCDREYEPDRRTAEKQRFCGRRECQKARRRRTARVWRRHNHLRHADDVTRVRGRATGSRLHILQLNIAEVMGKLV
ncbi:MAG: hypothetical protein WCS01_16355 [bacterium]